MKKYLWCGIFSAALLVLAVLVGIKSREWNPEERRLPGIPLSFAVPSGDGSETISCWTGDGSQYYVFLPSYAQLGQVRARVEPSAQVSLDGAALEDGTACGGFSLDKPYDLDVGGRPCSLTFMQSANVAAIYVETESGSMDYIHKNKKNKEKISITAYTADGQADYHSEGVDQITGRGNSTWSRPKRPYNILFSEPDSLLGMAESKKWCLLANSYDASNLRNWLAYDLARRVGFSWSPDILFVELYLNGEYEGLYLLVEAVTVEENRVNISEDGYLFSLDFASRVNFGRDAFRTELSQVVQIDYPDSPTLRQADALADYLSSMEHAMTSPEGVDPATGKSWDELIDVDSWVRKYLIEEISENLDGGITSQYFYADADADGLSPVAAGPVWDYDLAFGHREYPVIQNPACFYAAQDRIRHFFAPWYARLYAKPGFYERVTELYQQEFLPVLEGYLQSGIEEKADEISSAAAMNGLRWQSIDSLADLEDDTALVRQFLADRVGFLTSAWADGIDYCSVRVGTDGGRNIYRYYAVERGTRLPEELPTPGSMDLMGSVWYIQGTDEVFDPSAPITGDLVLTAPNKPLTLLKRLTAFTKEAVKVWPSVIFSVLFCGMILVDVRRHRKERR